MCSYPQATAVCLLNRMNNVIAQRLLFRKVGTKHFHTFPIVTVYPIIGTKPHQSLIILKKTKYGAIGQSLLIVYLLEKIGILYIVSYANQWTNQCDKN